MILWRGQICIFLQPDFYIYKIDGYPEHCWFSLWDSPEGTPGKDPPVLCEGHSVVTHLKVPQAKTLPSSVRATVLRLTWRCPRRRPVRPRWGPRYGSPRQRASPPAPQSPPDRTCQFRVVNTFELGGRIRWKTGIGDPRHGEVSAVEPEKNRLSKSNYLFCKLRKCYKNVQQHIYFYEFNKYRIQFSKIFPPH